MIIIVKLILVCQAKDRIIPQLIPLLWIISVFVVCLIIIMLIDIYYFRNILFLKENFLKENYKIVYLW